MGKLKKIGIGFGIIILSFFVLVFGIAVYNVSTTTESQEKPSQPVTVISEIESETTQSEVEKIVSEKELEKVEPSDNIEFDPMIVREAEQSIPDMQLIFRTVLDQCNAVYSYSDYLVLGNAMFIVQNEMVQSVEVTDKALSILEVLGYDEHPTVGPLIEETRQLIGDSGDCVRDLVNKYDN